MPRQRLDGVLRPLEPLVLREHQRVRLTLDERPGRRAGNLHRPSINGAKSYGGLPRSDPYAGEWVALTARAWLRTVQNWQP